METAKKVLHDPKMWNEIFAKFPLDEYQEKFVLKVIEKYALEKESEAFHDGYEKGFDDGRF